MFDTDLNPVERTQLIAAVTQAEETGELTEQLAQMHSQFRWDRSDDWYAGYVKGLMAAAELFRENPKGECSLLGGMLLLQAGLVLRHLIDEEGA